MRGRLLVPPPARDQGGVFSRAQAAASGNSSKQVRRAVQTGQWSAVVPGVLKADAESLSPYAAICAVGLAIGGVVAASHDTGAAWWRLPTASATRLHATVLPPRRPRVPGVRCHRVPFGPDDVVRVGVGLVTSRERTILDCLLWWPAPAGRNLVIHCLREGHLTPDSLRRLIDGASGRHGITAVRGSLADLTGNPHSEAEVLAHRLLRSAGITGWSANVPLWDAKGLIGVGDIVFARARVVVEIDGLQYHGGQERFQADRTRDNRLQVSGYVVIRFTWEDLVCRPSQVLDVIRAALLRAAA